MPVLKIYQQVPVVQRVEYINYIHVLVHVPCSEIKNGCIHVVVLRH